MNSNAARVTTICCMLAGATAIMVMLYFKQRTANKPQQTNVSDYRSKQSHEQNDNHAQKRSRKMTITTFQEKYFLKKRSEAAVLHLDTRRKTMIATNTKGLNSSNCVIEREIESMKRITMAYEFDKIAVVKLNDSLPLFLKYFEQWPPLSEFDNWPQEYVIYSQIYTKAQIKIHELNDIKLFRNWMYDEFKSIFGIKKKDDDDQPYNEKWLLVLKNIKVDLELGVHKHNGRLFGFFGFINKIMFIISLGNYANDT